MVCLVYMMSKKAQVTLFIIVGLMLVTLLAIIYAAQLGKKTNEAAAITLSAGDTVAVKSFVDNCVKQTASDGLLLIGAQGGYTYFTPIPFYTYSADIGYGYYEGVNTLPSLQTVGNELSKFVEKQLSSCTQNFESFKQQGYSFSGANLKAETTFTEDSTVVNLNWPLQLGKGKSKTTISDFSASVPVRIKKIYDVVKTIVKKQEENPEFVDFGYLKSTGFITVLQPINNDVIVYAIIDNQSMLFNSPYTFLFANKFSNFTTGNAPVLGFIPNLNATVGKEFNYQLKATNSDGKKLTFNSSSDLFSVDKDNGLIKFVPTAQQIGEHFAVVELKNEKGLKDSQLITTEVVANA